MNIKHVNIMYLFFSIEPQLTNNAYFSKLCCFSVSVYIHNKSICYIDSVTIKAGIHYTNTVQVML